MEAAVDCEGPSSVERSWSAGGIDVDDSLFVSRSVSSSSDSLDSVAGGGGA